MRPFLGLLLLVAPLLAASPDITFGDSYVVGHVSAHAPTYWLQAQAVGNLISATTFFAGDTDDQDAVRWDFGSIPPASEWALVDAVTGQSVTAGPQTGIHPSTPFTAGILELGPNGKLSRLIIPTSSAYVLWVRAGVGGWVTSVFSGTAQELDQTPGVGVLLTSQFKPKAGSGSPSPPEAFAPGDAIIAIYVDPVSRNFQVFDWTVPANVKPTAGAGTLTPLPHYSAIDGKITVWVERYHGADGTISVHYATADGTGIAGKNYTAASGTLVFGPGEYLKSFDIPTLPEPGGTGTRTVKVQFDPVGTSIDGNNPVEITFDALPALPVIRFSRATSAVSEGNLDLGLGQLFVDRVGDTDGTSSVHWSASGPLVGATEGTITFQPRQSRQELDIYWQGNTTPEPNRTIVITLSDVAGGTLGTATHTLTIIDDDAAPPVVSISDVRVSEGNNGTTDAVFVVTLSQPSTQQVSVGLQTLPGTARPGSDYVETTGSLTFAPGETRKEFRVKVVGDTTAEPDEWFTLNGVAPLNAVLGSAGTCTIVNDDGTPPTAPRHRVAQH